MGLFGYLLNPRYHYKAWLGEDHTREVKDGCVSAWSAWFVMSLNDCKCINKSMLSLGPHVPLAKT